MCHDILRLQRNGGYFAADIFKYIVFKDFFSFWLKFPKDRIGPVTDLVPIRQKDIPLNNGYTVHVPIYAQPMHIAA